MPDFKKLREKFVKDPKKTLMNMLILFLFGILLILIGDITGNLSSKKTGERNNSIQVNSNGEKMQESEIGSVMHSEDGDSYEKKTKAELIDTLSDISGVGKISVMINYESGEQSVPAFNETDSSKKTEEKDNEGGVRVTTESSKNQEIVMVNNGAENQPLVVKQFNPRVGGIVIVAEGAENPVTRERLFQAAKTVLNLPGSKVSVMPMK